MRNKLFSLILLLAATPAVSFASSINMNTPYTCVVTSSSDEANIPVGIKTKFDITLKRVSENGMVLFENSNKIFLYSRLSAFEAGGPGSGMLVLATDTSEPKETHSSIFITELPNHSIELEISMIDTAQVFSSDSGKATFVVKGVGGNYKLKCDERIL